MRTEGRGRGQTSYTRQDGQGHTSPGARELARSWARPFWEPQEVQPTHAWTWTPAPGRGASGWALQGWPVLWASSPRDS